jgi:GTP-binding protein
MRIREFSFVGSFGSPDALPDRGRAEIAFFGRSNVGKSSVLNTLLGTRNAAFTSKTPGRTGNANYFLVNDSFFFVDMPGYGFARVSKQEKARWLALQNGYLERPDNPAGVILILDIRHTPTQNDREMASRLFSTATRFCLVFNKADKAAKGVLEKTVAAHVELLDVQASTGVIPFSSVTGTGKRELIAWIGGTLGMSE